MTILSEDQTCKQQGGSGHLNKEGVGTRLSVRLGRLNNDVWQGVRHLNNYIMQGSRHLNNTHYYIWQGVRARQTL